MKPTPLWKSPAVLYTAFAAAFITFRLILFTIGTTASEFLLYQDYGEAARKQPLDELYRTRDIEYPQLAVLFGTLASIVADHLPEAADRWTYARPNTFMGPEHGRFEAGLSVVLAAVDVVCLVLVYLLARRFYPEEGVHRRLGRLLVYTVATGVLGPILYDRQDLVVAMFALLAMLTLAYSWATPGYVLLTIGTAYKLVPALLLPVWVLAAVAIRCGPNASPWRFLRVMVGEATIAAAILFIWPVLTYYLGGGERAFVFLTFHSARGLQLEAPAAWPLMLLDSTREVGHGYGAYNLRSPLADAIAWLLKGGMILAVGVAGLIAARGFWRAASGPVRPTPASLGPHVVASSLLVWLGFILANKVGSPQYLLWIAPLVPLMPLRGAREWCWLVLVVIVMILTTMIFPTAYAYVKGEFVHSDPDTWAGPNVWCILLLSARSLTLAAATVWLGFTVWRAARLVPTPPANHAVLSLRSVQHEPDPASGPLPVHIV